MKVGVHLNFQNYRDWDRFERKAGDEPQEITDAQIYEEDLHLGSLVEPLGYDSLWAIDHHFSPYIMTGGAVQNLTYFAGMTKRIDFGTMVVVLPWYDPIAICEQISVLDNMLQGRKLTIGLGRGAGQREFDGFRIPMGESRGRFLESLEILRKAWTSEFFAHEGEFFTIPETTIRPRPRTPDLLDHMRVAWISPGTLRIAADAGLGMLFTNQKNWEEYRADMRDFNAVRAEHGWGPKQPTVVVNVVCAQDRDEGWDRMVRHMTEAQESVERHYHFSDSAHFKQAKGYEFYELFENTLKKKSREEIGEFNSRPQIFGSPEECLDKVRYIQRMTSAEELVLNFRFGGMPIGQAEESLRRFAETVLGDVQAIEPQLHEYSEDDEAGVEAGAKEPYRLPGA